MSTCPQREVNNHPSCLGMKCEQHNDLSNLLLAPIPHTGHNSSLAEDGIITSCFNTSTDPRALNQINTGSKLVYFSMYVCMYVYICSMCSVCMWRTKGYRGYNYRKKTKNED